VVDEVQRPACIGFSLQQDRRPRSYSFAAGSSLADGEPFLAIKPVDPVDPRRFALAAQQDEQPTVAETPPLIGKIAQPATQCSIRRAAGTIADHLPIRAHDRAGPPFRQAHDGLPMRDRSALGGGPYHFFERSSRRAAVSSICSAKSFFSFPFSSSKALNRFASETSMPPNLAFQL